MLPGLFSVAAQCERGAAGRLPSADVRLGAAGLLSEPSQVAQQQRHMRCCHLFVWVRVRCCPLPVMADRAQAAIRRWPCRAPGVEY
mmetsp:Transcript_69077/g.152502  ORF Transcript_69077/g.152502 Transcript_69077/m.152502 type:complete len:86 (+) Transcript_69077:324-581(+)